jgi:hypothetical protein
MMLLPEIILDATKLWNSFENDSPGLEFPKMFANTSQHARSVKVKAVHHHKPYGQLQPLPIPTDLWNSPFKRNQFRLNYGMTSLYAQ